MKDVVKEHWLRTEHYYRPELDREKQLEKARAKLEPGQTAHIVGGVIFISTPDTDITPEPYMINEWFAKPKKPSIIARILLTIRKFYYKKAIE